MSRFRIFLSCMILARRKYSSRFAALGGLVLKGSAIVVTDGVTGVMSDF